MNKNILVFVEQRGGKIHPACYQLLALAGKLVETTVGQVEACIAEGAGPAA